MNIEAKEFTITLSHSDLWNTAFDVKNAFEHSVKEHWKNHPTSWMQNEKNRLYRIRTMFSHMGRLDVYDNMILETEKYLKQFMK